MAEIREIELTKNEKYYDLFMLMTDSMVFLYSFSSNYWWKLRWKWVWVFSSFWHFLILWCNLTILLKFNFKHTLFCSIKMWVLFSCVLCFDFASFCWAFCNCSTKNWEPSASTHLCKTVHLGIISLINDIKFIVR